MAAGLRARAAASQTLGPVSSEANCPSLLSAEGNLKGQRQKGKKGEEGERGKGKGVGRGPFILQLAGHLESLVKVNGHWAVASLLG